MKRKKTNTLTLVAAALALVGSTYVLAAAHQCHDPSTIETCRAVVEQALHQTPDSTAIIGGEECALANEASDDLVGYSTSFNQYGYQYCIGSTTYCGVAYNCPTLGVQMVEYNVGPWGWFEIYDAGGYCQDCPDVPGLGW